MHVDPRLQWLLAVRFMVGIGLGGVPVAFALFAEFCPIRGRGGWLIALQAFWTFGSMAEAAIAWAVLVPLGWRTLLALSAAPFGAFSPSTLAKVTVQGCSHRAMYSHGLFGKRLAHGAEFEGTLSCRSFVTCARGATYAGDLYMAQHLMPSASRVLPTSITDADLADGSAAHGAVPADAGVATLPGGQRSPAGGSRRAAPHLLLEPAPAAARHPGRRRPCSSSWR